jgi:hypothetical protein
VKITANNSKGIKEFVSEAGKISNGSSGRQIDRLYYFILNYSNTCADRLKISILFSVVIKQH